MKRERKPKSRRTVIAVMILGCLLGIGGFGVLIAAAIMQDRGYGVNDGLVMLLSFGLMILSVAVLFSVLQDALRTDMEMLDKKYDARVLVRISGLGQAHVRELFLAQGFRDTGGGYLKRRFFTLAKDSIRYYVRCAPALDVGATLSAELQRFDRAAEEGREGTKNLCLYLFLYKSDITEVDRKRVQEASKGLLLGETVVPTKVFRSCLIILVDQDTGEGCFLDMSKGISVYAHACRRLKKYFPSRV